jgi:hypothetical protein
MILEECQGRPGWARAAGGALLYGQAASLSATILYSLFKLVWPHATQAGSSEALGTVSTAVAPSTPTAA